MKSHLLIGIVYDVVFGIDAYFGSLTRSLWLLHERV